MRFFLCVFYDAGPMAARVAKEEFFAVNADEGQTMVIDLAASAQTPAHELLVRGWIATYGAGTVIDTIQTCSLEWSYSLKPRTDLTNDQRFWDEVERRLVAKKQHGRVVRETKVPTAR